MSFIDSIIFTNMQFFFIFIAQDVNVRQCIYRSMQKLDGKAYEIFLGDTNREVVKVREIFECTFHFNWICCACDAEWYMDIHILFVCIAAERCCEWFIREHPRTNGISQRIHCTSFKTAYAPIYTKQHETSQSKF